MRSRPAADALAPGLCQAFDRGGEIYAQGEPATAVYKVLGGAVRLSQLLADGRRQVGGFYLAGEMFGFTDAAHHDFTAEALAPTRLMAIRRDALLTRMAREPLLAREMWSFAAAELARAQRHFMVLGRKTACERVASFLLDMARRTGAGNGDAIVLVMCRQDIADYLGLTIETVSRMMTRLEQSGLIALPSSRRVRILDAEGLRALEE
ncbi:MAG: Crp/Fnr family transcriptional regulator [Alphaproteobacteria bacterium]|nr:MAG: Crp/Fnr family transcriptional regulator [Alphaproteobacteria bacterium]